MNQRRASRRPSNLGSTTNGADNEGDHAPLSTAPRRSVNESALFRKDSILLENRINRESVTLVWLDLQSQSTSTFVGLLRVINDHVQIYNDADVCLNALRASRDTVFVIVSPHQEELVTSISKIDRVEAIFVLDAEISPAISNIQKLIGVATQQEELTRLVKETLDTFSQVRLETFLFEADELFLWLQLWREDTMSRRISESSKSELVAMARDYYRTNAKRIRLIDDFDRAYRAKEALQHCVLAPFPSYVVKHALMSCRPEQLEFCRFLIADASRSIQQQPKRAASLQLYRGMKLTSTLIDSFESHSGKVVCVNGFFACTKSRTVALNSAASAGYRPDLASVFFKIECDASAGVAELPTENHSSIVVFDFGTTFRILCVSRGLPSVIKMKAMPDEGKRLAREFIKSHEGSTIEALLDQFMTRSKSPTPPPEPQVPLSSKSSDSGPKLSREETEAENHVKNGEIDLAISTYQRIRPLSSSALVRLGHLYSDHKGDYRKALECYVQALGIQEKAGEDIADILTRIGRVYHELGQFDSALEHHRRALKLRQSTKPPNQAAIATNMIGISNAHRARHQLNEALDYAKQACAIRESIVPANEVAVGSSLATLASIYHDLGDSQQALAVTMRALETFRRALPENAPEVAALLNNLAAIELSLGATQDARRNFEKSLKIYRQILPPEHPNIAKLENNIRSIQDLETKRGK